MSPQLSDRLLAGRFPTVGFAIPTMQGIRWADAVPDIHGTLTTRPHPADAQCSYGRSRSRRDGLNGFQAQYALEACVWTKQ
jgi:hypothetical protein